MTYVMKRTMYLAIASQLNLRKGETVEEYITKTSMLISPITRIIIKES